MLMHDHEKKHEGGVYCPLMKGLCIDGWTKEMGEDKDGKRPRCVKWRPVTLMIGGPVKGTPREVWDCTDAWLPDLLVQVSQESYHAGAATEDARNHVAAQASAIRRMSMAMLGIARRQGVSKQDIQSIEAEITEAEKQAQLPPPKP